MSGSPMDVWSNICQSMHFVVDQNEDCLFLFIYLFLVVVVLGFELRTSCTV
jgi:hypothetical protein